MRERAVVNKKGRRGGKRRRVEKGCTRSMVEEGRGSRLRAGQYAQAGHGGSYGNEMGSREISYGRPGRPGGEMLAGGAKTVGGAIPLPGDLPFSGPLAEPLKVTPGEFLEEPLAGPGVRGGQSEENLSLPLKVPLSAPLWRDLSLPLTV